MSKLHFLTFVSAVLLLAACGQNANKKDRTVKGNNPLLEPSSLPYGAPDFKAIGNEHFAPAFAQGMEEHLNEIDAIVNNSEAPTFENTLVALEKSGSTLNRVRGVFDLLSGANTNPDIQKTEEEIAPKLAAHRDAIFLNDKLFQRVKTLHNQRAELGLDPESNKLVEFYYQKFEMAGANLADTDKAVMKKLNEEAASLEAQFNNRLLAATKAGALILDDKAKLAGLSDTEIQIAAQAAEASNQKGKYLIPLQNTTQHPALQSLLDRDVRKQLFEHSIYRTSQNDSNDTRQLIVRLSEIRAQQAHLLGFNNFAEWKLQDQMAKTPANAIALLDKLVPAAKAKALEEAAELQKQIDKEKGGFKLEAWDWALYSEKVRKEKYDLDESQIKPYFELYNVLENGVFFAAHELYGINFKERHDIPVYHEDVRVFELFEADSTAIGLFYCDFFKRDNKAGGAWMSNIVEQSKLLGHKPVIYNVCNYTKPAAGQPALISYDDVTTLFHEFGHALHGFFANQQYPSLSGTNVSRDFVELPSQINEHWALYPKVFNNYAVHYETKQPMPKELVEKIRNAKTFNEGFAFTEILAASGLDLQWHTIGTDMKIADADQFEAGALKRLGLDMSQIPPRYRSPYFKHIWSNGYAAGYYAYTWASVLDNDAFAWFEENGGLSRANGQRFRDMVLSRGNSDDLHKLYVDFRGKEPDIKPLLKNRGLLK
ncbi:MAG: peptidyl-dipeptidase Dcp [Breznakibacter sp.]